ncbi:uncharacterized protein DUF5052 [Keratinibaculum paraultunense]|uniref:Uncharacterized protein DUF5052 n=1 Tax=Keratinibaculum paraultunense TaxID=1278232 RepID=A0A4R3KQE9_9FIRM|nr:DUF5052 family protein [Keratinibaculum paraultunense]QQY79656.1 DUF5052 family protein [Keratinibaculum paraultunense]TCS87079.1 uncharacterized protein DUF5052 [Keratinibaculum paraultunense]
MKKLNKKSKIVLILIINIFIFSLSGCAQIRDKLKTIRGELIGIHFTISAYDHYANKTLEVDGSKVTVGVLENEANIDPSSTGYQSGVLEITVNGKQMFQVGNTVIFAEDGLDVVEDFELPSDITVGKGGGFVPMDRFINNIKNKIGKEKTIIISSQMGIPLAVYQGKNVYVTVPDDLPKMTRLNIDGKSLYIHRANYIILDTEMMK